VSPGWFEVLRNSQAQRETQPERFATVVGRLMLGSPERQSAELAAGSLTWRSDRERATVSRLSAAIPRVALRRTAGPRPASSLSWANTVLSMAAKGRVRWCEWHGMQGVRGSNPLSSTRAQRITRTRSGC
jgi:hypothetical protein